MADFIEFLSPKALQDLALGNAELVKMVANINDVNTKMKGLTTPSSSNGAIKNLSAEYEKQAQAIQKLQAQLTKLQSLENKQTASSKKLEAQSIKESNARNSLNRQREVTLKQLESEESKLATAGNYYNKLQAELTKLSFAYKDLAARQQMGSTLSKVEGERMAYLEKRIKTLDTTLKGVDGAMGKYQRNVGNYAGSFNPLSNSINQLTREMPAFTYSVQTGFMAISNNLPIFFDAMGNVIEQNKQLQAQGKPTTSVLKQLASSLFSFQTLMGVGITLLTVYGKEIGIWIKSLWGASDALDSLNENQKKFNDAKQKGRKDAVSEIVELKKYLAVVKDDKISMEERNIALKQLRSQYPFYFKELSDLQILAGDYADAENKLKIALDKRKEVEDKSDIITSNKQNLIDLEQKRIKVLKDIEYQEKRNIKLGSLSDIEARTATNDRNTALNRYNNGISKLATLKKDLATLNKNEIAYNNVISKQEADIIKLKGETIGLEFSPETDKKREKERAYNLEIVDFLANRYALERKTLEDLMKNNEAIANNEGETFKKREEQRALFYQRSIKLAELDKNEQLRLIGIASTAEINELNRAYKAGEITISQKNEAIEAIERQSLYDRQLAFQNFGQTFKELTQEYAKDVDKLIQYIGGKQEELNFIDQAELDKLKGYIDVLANLDLTNSSKDFENVENTKTKIKENAVKKRLALDLLEINNQIENFDKTKQHSQEYLELQNKRIAIEAKIQEATSKTAEETAAKLKQTVIEMENYIKGFGDSFMSQFGTIGKIINGEITGFGENASVTALAMSEAFQDAINFIDGMQEQAYQKQLNRLSMQRDNAILFAGESATAQAEIERQYDERRKQMARERAKQEKQTAIFNAVINMAQGIMSTIAQNGFPAAIPMIAAIGILGAAQIAMISSQPIPAYAEGTDNHIGGAMLVNDGKGSNYQEKVITPDGKVITPKGRNVMMNAPKGTKVLTHEQWKNGLDNILTDNGISYNNDSQTANVPIINVETKDNYHFNIDERGINKTITRGAAKANIINSRLRIKSKTT